MRKPSKVIEVAHLRREAWNMWIDCPEDELEECLVYECARLSEFWPFAWANLRELGGPKEWVPLDVGWHPIFEFLCLFPEFPEQSYLQISKEIRSLRLQQLQARAYRWPPVASADQSQFAYPKPVIQKNEHPGPHWEPGLEVFAKYRRRSVDESGFVHLLRIDWIRTDDELIKGFADWIRERRPADYHMHNRVGRPRTGPDAFRRWLRAVGARALSKSRGKQSREAVLRASEIRDAGGRLISPRIYSDEREMRKAEAVAEKRLREVSPHTFEASRGGVEVERAHYSTTEVGKKGYTLTVREPYLKFESVFILHHSPRPRRR